MPPDNAAEVEHQTQPVPESRYAAPEPPSCDLAAERSRVDDEIKTVKSERQLLDGHIQVLKSMPGSRERALSITKLQEAVMWLGMDLKRIGEENPGKVENPYPHSKDPSNTKIDPTAQGLKL